LPRRVHREGDGRSGWDGNNHTKYDTTAKRAAAVLAVLKASGKEPRELRIMDFRNAGKRPFLKRYYGNDVSRALREAGLHIEPEDMVRISPRRIFKRKEDMVRAVRECIAKSGKRPEEVQWGDLRRGGLYHLVAHYKLPDLIAEAGYDFHPWQRASVPAGFWDSRRNRGDAVRWLVRRTGLAPERIRCKDVLTNGLSGLWQHVSKRVRTASGTGRSRPPDVLHILLGDAGFGDILLKARRRALMEARTAARLRQQERVMREVESARREAERARRKEMQEERAARRHLTPARAREVVEDVLAKTGKDIYEVLKRDFEVHGYHWAVKSPGDCPRLLRLAGMEIEPWEMRRVPSNFWKSPKNRAEAFRWLVGRTGKAPGDLRESDFLAHGLTCLARYSPDSMLRAAGFDIPHWLPLFRRGRWALREDRVEATRWLMKKTGKRGHELTRADFTRNGLHTLWNSYHPQACKRFPRGEMLGYGEGWLLRYKNPALRAAAEAGALDREHDERARMKHPPRLYGNREARAAAVRGTVKACGKPPEEMRGRDFRRAQKWFLIKRYYGGDIVAALRDAGFDVRRQDMRRWVQPAKWKDPEARRGVVRAFVEASGKRPEELMAKDFAKAGHGSFLLYKSFNGLLLEAGYNVIPWLMSRVPSGFWGERRNRALAVHWLLERTGLSAIEVGPRHFLTNRLGGMWNHMSLEVRARLCGRRPRAQDVLAQLMEDAGLLAAAEQIRRSTRKRPPYKADGGGAAL